MTLGDTIVSVRKYRKTNRSTQISGIDYRKVLRDLIFNNLIILLMILTIVWEDWFK